VPQWTAKNFVEWEAFENRPEIDDVLNECRHCPPLSFSFVQSRPKLFFGNREF
jgi:hypothetical protein